MSNQSRNARRKSGGHRIFLAVLCCVLAVVLVLLMCATAYMEYVLNQINRDVNNETLSDDEIHAIQNPDVTEGTLDVSVPSMNPDDVTWGDGPEVQLPEEHMINILLIGQDRRPGEGRQRSDVMILCSFNTKNNSLTMTSFMRDLYVEYPGKYQDDRINAAYQLGGMELLNETLKLNFGIEIDGNVEVDFSQFKQIIDLLGGVDIELTSAEANYMNNKWGSGLSAGMQHLNGEQALYYSRIRYIDSDFERTNRQRTVLNALLKTYKNISMTKLLSMMDDILPLVTTDMSNQEIIGYATKLLPVIANSDIRTQRIPADGTFEYASIRGMSVLVPDLEANRKVLVESLTD